MVNQTAQKVLLIFSIGPVQSFIATARRTQDLYVSSSLLSHLAKVGVKAAEQAKAKLIYPVQIDGQWPASVPNRFVAEVDTTQINQIATAIEGAIQREWQTIADKTQKYFAKLAPQQGWEAAWHRQVDGWLETHWAAWRWEEVNESYGQAFHRAGLAMDARKRIRDFPKWPEPGEKCTLSGVHEALGPDTFDRQRIRDFWQKIAESNSVMPSELRSGERLSAISTIKRFAAKDIVGVTELGYRRFPSTSSIAAASFRQSLLEQWEDLGDIVNAHLQALEALGVTRFAEPEPFPYLLAIKERVAEAKRLLSYDGDFFYQETFEPERLKEALGKPADEAKRQKAIKTLSALLTAAANHNQKIAPPHLYLAVLVLDGDRMGKLLSSCNSVEQHQKISRVLAQFAQTTVQRIVEVDHPGSLVYAGGDDVLALMPVNVAIAVAQKIQSALSQALQNALRTEGREQESSRPTASAGIAIAHHIQPLEGALRAARSAEHAAKEELGRNALVVDVVRRSGEKQRVGMKWDDLDADITDALAPILETQQLMKQKILSGKVGYDLQSESVADWLRCQRH
ncbi:MAG: type III-B CRISPR-associated protein Cas10/Cmr2 [Caldilineaceae bacterium]